MIDVALIGSFIVALVVWGWLTVRNFPRLEGQSTLRYVLYVTHIGLAYLTPSLAVGSLIAGYSVDLPPLPILPVITVNLSAFGMIVVGSLKTAPSSV